MLKKLLVVLALIGVAGFQTTSPNLSEINNLPDGLRVIHTPNPVRAHSGGRSGYHYTWQYETTVEAIDRPITIEQFGSFDFRGGTWQFSNFTGKPFTRANFVEWYSCPDAALELGKTCSDPQNWSGRDRLGPGRMLWYFIGHDSAGNRVKGQSVIELVGEISPAN